MWKAVIPVVWWFLVAAYLVSEATGAAVADVQACLGDAVISAVQEGNDGLQERLAALELLMYTQAQAQKNLEESLKNETDRRLAIETLFLRTLDEQMVTLESSLEVEHDRLLALESTLKEEISLREDAELSGKDILLDLSKKITVMEGDLTMVSLLDSRLRSLEEQGMVQVREIFNLQQQLQQTRRGVEQMKRETRRQRTTLTKLVASDSDVTQATLTLRSQLDSLTSWCLALNESADEHGKMLLEAQKRSVVLNTSLGDVHTLLSNLSGAVTSLQQAKEDSPLVLCPQPYQKVGKDCYYLLEERHAWEEAREACVDQAVAVGGEGDLAEPSDISTFRHYVHSLQTESKYLWVGGWRKGGGQGWWWVSDKSFQEAPVPWDLSEPDNAPDQHHLCVHSAATIKFHDCTRQALLSAICQMT